MSFLMILLAGVLVLGPLIAIHEFGHFWVARRCGVQVLTFSIGFGPSLWRRVAADGVEYRIAVIPLGGYVRMLDEREAEVPEALKHRAFNRQSLAKRAAIVAAGPLINLLFAIVLFWGLNLQSEGGLKPVVGDVVAGSAADVAGIKAGDEFIEIAGRPVSSWEKVSYGLIGRAGESGELQIKVKALDASQSRQLVLTLDGFLAKADSDPLHSLGITPWSPPLDPVLGRIESGSRAAQAGLQLADRVVSVNDQPISDWMQLVELIVNNPEQDQQWTVLREGQLLTLTVRPDSVRDGTGKTYGRLGIGVQQSLQNIPAAYRHAPDFNPLTALWAAVEKTWQLIEISLSSLVKMITGLIGVDALSGPITIVQVAGQTADIGWQAFIGFMALLSVSLGVLNLLPIPVLDGGHLLFYAFEAVLGRPLPDRIQQMGLQIGIAILGSVMLLAVFNDIRRLF